MKTTTSQHGERCLWRRSWSVGIATALLAAAPFVASAQSDGTTGGENSNTIYKSVAELPGRTFEELQAGITTSCSYDDPSKVYFLYNVGSGKFLNMGGYWGTHASMKDYPMPLWTRNGTAMQTFTEVSTPSLNFTQNIAAEGSMLKWVNSGANKTTDMGVFCDRPENHNSNGYDGWFFEATNDGKNTYTSTPIIQRKLPVRTTNFISTLTPMDRLRPTKTVEQIQRRNSFRVLRLTII